MSPFVHLVGNVENFLPIVPLLDPQSFTLIQKLGLPYKHDPVFTLHAKGRKIRGFYPVFSEFFDLLL